jgi:hypothetical protein
METVGLDEMHNDQNHRAAHHSETYKSLLAVCLARVLFGNHEPVENRRRICEGYTAPLQIDSGFARLPGELHASRLQPST